MLTLAQIDNFQARLQTKMLEVAIEQAKAELNDDISCAKEHQCMYRFLSIYLAVFTNPLFNYTMAETEAMILWISAIAGLNEVVPVSFTDYTVINIGTDHEHTISQIIGLQEILYGLQSQIDAIKNTGLFVPIVTNSGRNLDYPAPPYNATHNFQTQEEAWEYVLDPYAPPSVGFANDIIADVEIGSTFNNGNGNITYTFNIYNTPSILLESVLGTNKKVYYTSPSTPSEIISGATKYPLTDQNGYNVTQSHNANINVNSNVTGKVNVFTVYVRGKVNPELPTSVYGASAFVRFRIRSAVFLWRANDDISKYSDNALSSLLRTLGDDFAGGKYTTMADGDGNKSFGTINWDTKAYSNNNSEHPAVIGNDGFFNICMIAPASAGTPIIYNPASGPNSPQKLVTHPFMYSNGTATGDRAVLYNLYMNQIVDKITGKYTTTII